MKFNEVRQYLVNVVLFGTKGLQTSEMLESNLCVRPVNVFPNFQY